jgi:indolepyruvate ferredoxin oxidoreductase beta subunit
MKSDIIVAGVGGQGILSIAATIGQAALIENLFIKQSEVHGMSQRGGAVMSHMRISSEPVWSDLIPIGSADMILSIEPMESLRYLPYLSENGWVITNTNPFENIPNYPSKNDILKELEALRHKVYLDADELAVKAGSIKASNIVTLGAAIPFLQLKPESVEKGIEMIFGSKGQQIVDLNIKAFHLGYEFALSSNK